MKIFHWRDLHNLLDICGEGRTRVTLARLLSGDTVNLKEFGGNPKRKYNKRSPSAFRGHTKYVLRQHAGVKIDGDIVSIPELQKPTSYLK